MAWHNGDYPTITSLTDADILLGAQSGSSNVFTLSTLKTAIGAKSANILNTDSTLLGTDANTSEKTLFSYIMPAATLSTDGWFIRILAWGYTGDTANTKRIILRTGTPYTLFDSAASVITNKKWYFECILQRTAAGNQDVYNRLEAFEPAGGWDQAVVGVADKEETTENLNSAITFDLIGRNGSAVASDVVYEGSIILLNG